MEDTHVLCVVAIEMVIKLLCAILSLLIGNYSMYSLRISEGELRMCRKVGNDKEEVLLDTKTNKEVSEAAESIKEPIDVSSDSSTTEAIPEVSLSEESERKQIKFSDQIEFK